MRLLKSPCVAILVMAASASPFTSSSVVSYSELSSNSEYRPSLLDRLKCPKASELA